jgi:GNAT superfamily N-acetyltransferase
LSPSPSRADAAGVRQADHDDLTSLGDLELRAYVTFSSVGIELEATPTPVGILAAAALVLVEGRPPRAMCEVEIVDGSAHLEQLCVDPGAQRLGIGSALVRAACSWAAASGYPSMTVCTFRDVAFNGPFYRSMGFEALDPLTPGLARIRARERRNGLDDLGARIVLVRRLGSAGSAP